MKKLMYPVAIHWEMVGVNEENVNDSSFNVMSKEYYSKVAEEIVKAKPVKVILSGIYSLNAFDNIKDAITILIENNIYVNIHTTLFSISEDMLSFFSGKNIELLITLPFEDDIVCDKSTADIIKKEINRLKAANVKFKINMVVCNSNFKFVFDTAKYVKNDLNCSHFFVSRASCNIPYFAVRKDLLLNKNDFTELLNTLLQIEHELNIEVIYLDSCCYYNFEVNKNTEFFDITKKCMAGVNSFFVTFLGDVKECENSAKEYGNILDMTLMDIISKIKENAESSVPFNSGNAMLVVNDLRYDQIEKLYCSVDTMFSTIINTGDRTQLINSNWDGYVFKVNPNCVIVKDEDCYRISLKDKYVFVSEELYEYIKNARYISEINFRKSMKISLKHAEAIIDKLEKLGVLIVHSN